MSVQVRNIIIFIVSITKGSVLSIAPIVNLIFLIEDDTEVSSGSNSLDIMSLECLYFSGFRYNLGNIFAVSGWANRVDEQFHEHIDILASVSKGIDLSFL